MVTPDKKRLMTLFLCGDVMTGRGIDQVLPHPASPQIFESHIRTSRGYVELAEAVNGPIPNPVKFTYPWGDALVELERVRPDVRIINLETAITRSRDFWRGKGINYRMNPENLPVLTAAGIDIASLANNHVLDWGYEGLSETLDNLRGAGIMTAGAGKDITEAKKPAVMEIQGKGRVLVLGLGSETSGILSHWAATAQKPGVNVVNELSDKTVRRVQADIGPLKKPGDVLVVSIHWGGNWGDAIPGEQKRCARKLIDEAGVDIVHGHSSHHVKGIEVYRGKLILYGCGDFINDYEGIRGYEEFRGDLGLMYFARIDPSTGTLTELEMTPTHIRSFRVKRASKEDTVWLMNTLNRQGKEFGTTAEWQKNNTLRLRWT